MPRNGSGTYIQPAGTAGVDGEVIYATPYNNLVADIGNELTNSVNVSGTKAMNAALPMGNNRITLLANPTGAQDAATKSYVDGQISGSATTFIGGTTTGTAGAQVLASVSPNTFTLTAGYRIVFTPGFTPTGPTTLAITAPVIAAKNIMKMSPLGLLPLAGGEMIVGQETEALYDGTQYILLQNVAAETGPRTSLASAATTDLGTISSRNIGITGTTTITSFGSAASTAFPLYFLTFAGALTLTHNATSLILPGAANILTRAGDTAIALYLGSGNWQVITYQRASLLLTGIEVPKRQTVLQGPMDTNGLPTFFPATSANLTLTMQNVSSSGQLIATIAQSFGAQGQQDLVVVVNSNLAVTVNASATSFIWLDDTGILGVAALAPIYQYGGTASVASGQHTYIIGQGQMYVGNGSVAAPTNRVFIGEAIASASAITSTVAYAYQRSFQYTDTGSLPAAGTKTSKNHNVGTAVGIMGAFALQCAIAEGNYAVGDIVYGVATEAGGGPWWGPLEPVMLRNAMYFTPGALNGYVLFNATNGAGLTLTNANWRYILIATSTW
ncbi:hypothetical protein AB4037_08540 [Labrys sp. KB_33_2]|uniref:hypothetical protein n=1 Tax=Labrys sp. KB_33_2 TaxID=3237479 RepID=UPI003F8E8799